MAVSTDVRTELLHIDGAAFAENFAKRPLGVRHTLADHPLLTLDALAELADRLPPASIERHRADLDLMTPGGAPELEGPPSQSVREIDTGNTWMVLWYIEQDPEYKALLDACLDEVETFVGDRHGGMQYRRGYIFISAPNATTPVHFDPEQNLLLQIRGRKEMNVGRFANTADHQPSSTDTSTGVTATSIACPTSKNASSWIRMTASTCIRLRRTGCRTGPRPRSRFQSHSGPPQA